MFDIAPLRWHGMVHGKLEQRLGNKKSSEWLGDSEQHRFCDLRLVQAPVRCSARQCWVSFGANVEEHRDVLTLGGDERREKACFSTAICR